MIIILDRVDCEKLTEHFAMIFFPLLELFQENGFLTNDIKDDAADVEVNQTGWRSRSLFSKLCATKKTFDAIAGHDITRFVSYQAFQFIHNCFKDWQTP